MRCFRPSSSLAPTPSTPMKRSKKFAEILKRNKKFAESLKRTATRTSKKFAESLKGTMFGCYRKPAVTDEIEDKGKETDREKLLGGASTDTKPRVRTAEEIKAKYRKTEVGDASAAAALARDKLAERGEKLQKVSECTAELQDEAKDFASMCKELNKRMEELNKRKENRKWWQIWQI